MSKPGQVEYAAVFTEDLEPDDPRAVGSGEALRSLAAWLDVSVAEVIELRDRGQLAGRIERRNAARTSDPNVALRHIERRLAPG